MDVISQNGTSRWIVPRNSKLVLPVLKSWKPYKLTSRMQWRVILAASRFNIVYLLPKTVRTIIKIDLSYWDIWLDDFSESWEVLVHVGNPSYTRKSIVFFVDRTSSVRAVAKLPLQASAKAAILHEAVILRKLQSKRLFPRILFADEQLGIAAQTWVRGTHVSRKFGKQHIELLRQLADDNVTVCLSDCHKKIAAWVGQLDIPLEPSLLNRALGLLENDRELPAFIEHRDFVPWNLRRLPDGRLTLIDWEWAVENSLPWQDICRFFYMQDYLFRGPGKVWTTLTGNPLLQTYIHSLGIPAEILPGLTMHYLLRTLCLDWSNSNHLGAAYTMDQIRVLLDQI